MKQASWGPRLTGANPCNPLFRKEESYFSAFRTIKGDFWPYGEEIFDMDKFFHMTLLLTAVFYALTITGAVAAEQFVTIFTVIVGFYFGTRAQKAADKKTE